MNSLEYEARCKLAHTVWNRAYLAVSSDIASTVTSQTEDVGRRFDKLWRQCPMAVATGALSRVIRPTDNDITPEGV